MRALKSIGSKYRIMPAIRQALSAPKNCYC